MRVFLFLLLTTALLAGCSRFDPADQERAQAAAIAGGIALSTINKCLVHMQQARNTSTPECNAAEQVRAYEEAKSKVKKPLDDLTLQGLDARIDAAREEAVGALVTLALEAAGRKG